MIAWIALVISIASLAVAFRNSKMTHDLKAEEKRTELYMVATRLSILYQSFTYELDSTISWLNESDNAKFRARSVIMIEEYRRKLEKTGPEVIQLTDRVRDNESLTPVQIEDYLRSMKVIESNSDQLRKEVYDLKKSVGAPAI